MTGKEETLSLIRGLADEQRRNADQLLALAQKAREQGSTWRELGLAAGVNFQTLCGQVEASSPVVVAGRSTRGRA